MEFALAVIWVIQWIGYKWNQTFIDKENHGKGHVVLWYAEYSVFSYL